MQLFSFNVKICFSIAKKYKFRKKKTLNINSRFSEINFLSFFHLMEKYTIVYAKKCNFHKKKQF